MSKKQKDRVDWILICLMWGGVIFLVIYTIPNMIKDWNTEIKFYVECENGSKEEYSKDKLIICGKILDQQLPTFNNNFTLNFTINEK